MRACLSLFLFLCLSALGAPPAIAAGTSEAAPLAIGDTFTLESTALGETRRINVYRPPGYAEAGSEPLPVLYMPDGGIGEDFLHVAGLVQVLSGNGGMRPFLLVGIENTERRRDLTGPTGNAEDRKIAKRVGGSKAFRNFLRDELMPEVQRRYRTTSESAIVGESLAGLFVVETFFLEPELFDTYLAFDPSLWWNDEQLVKDAPAVLAKRPALQGTLYLASSDEPRIAASTARLGGILATDAPAGLLWNYEPMPAEQHGTIYHPAALRGFRAVLGKAKD
jgi:predicted alpha/beta superfamily hydrolase